MSSSFDIEKFPTSPSAVRMLSRVSPIYERSYVGKWLYQVMGLEIDTVRGRFEELRAQAFPETATWGLSYWEQRYGITPPDGQSIEERRRAILTKRGLREPMNPAKMEWIIEMMTGCTAHVTEDTAPYTFTVEVETNPALGAFNFDAVFSKLKRIKPSHLKMEFFLTAATGIRIGATQRAYPFPYRLAGTYPQVNTPGGYAPVIIQDKSEGAAYGFTYPQTGEHRAGTLPQENIVAVIRDSSIEDMSEGAPYGFTYPQTGEHQAGTLPQDNIVAAITEARIEATGDGQGTPFPYEIAGTNPDTNRIAVISEASVQAAAAGESTAFPYPMTGQAPAGTFPSTNTVAAISGEGVGAFAETESLTIQYPLCGDDDV